MPSFDTSAPISAVVHVEAGSVLFAAGDRHDTAVDVRPHAPEKELDVRTAEQTEVTYANGTLSVRTPKPTLLGRTGTVDITVHLPAGSHVDLTGGWARVLGEGTLGDVRVKTSVGDVRLGTTGQLRVDSPDGSVSVDRVEGRAEITTSSGSLRVGHVDGPAVLTNAHGTTIVTAVTGELRVTSTNGDVEVGRAGSSITATTTHGAVRVGEAARGAVQLETSYGSIDVGVREGTAALLDVRSGLGLVHNALAPSGAPDESEETVRVRARTRHGSINVRRAAA
ncbi:DUF4097 family beta strand repeat-containing protein [Streptomyces sp. NPDC050504]|uniref:DUF4097 family beta strand repeat-containing protein n=1 Tax=Streptomyces sp. NPDC050504 TaxID=3365618 RepID=UPI003794C807